MRLDQLEWEKSVIANYEFAVLLGPSLLIYRNKHTGLYQSYRYELGPTMTALEAQCWVYERLKKGQDANDIS
jgi:hypothetical protein